MTIEELRDYIEAQDIAASDLKLMYGDEAGNVKAIQGAIFTTGPDGEAVIMLSPMRLNLVGGI